MRVLSRAFLTKFPRETGAALAVLAVVCYRAAIHPGVIFKHLKDESA
jgi:hypothetical protein